MALVKPYTPLDLKRLVRKRTGEKKLGEAVHAAGAEWAKALKKSPARFVIVGIAEDIGVRANFGRPGAHSAFKPALTSFLNQQENVFFHAGEVLVLGEVLVDDLLEKADALDARSKESVQTFRDLVSLLDERVAEVVGHIVAAGKIPVVIGGGHNNAYGNIEGSSRALLQKINVINCDPHLDFRALEGRHSGNGFSYAFEAGYIDRYAVLCMHEQYNNAHAVEQFRAMPGHLFYESFEDVFVRRERSFDDALRNCAGFVSGRPCGIEMDLDAISNVPSSARTSSGITALQARQYVHNCASQLNCVYLHIAEAAPVLSHIRADIKTGKLIAYLVTDFIKAFLSRGGD